jgi:predicted nuclease of predicted toxin-antitoxin system
VKLLIDNCISSRVGDELKELGHDVEHVAAWPADPGDRRILAHAAATERIVITADGDFGQLVVFERLPSAGVIILDQEILPTEHANACTRALLRHGADLLAGGVVIVTADRMRARPPKPSA